MVTPGSCTALDHGATLTSRQPLLCNSSLTGRTKPSGDKLPPGRTLNSFGASSQKPGGGNQIRGIQSVTLAETRRRGENRPQAKFA